MILSLIKYYYKMSSLVAGSIIFSTVMSSVDTLHKKVQFDKNKYRPIK